MRNADPLGIAEYENVRVVRGEDELALCLARAQFIDNMISDKRIVEIAFRLVDDEGVWVVEQQRMQNGGALLAHGQPSHLAVVFTVFGRVQQQFHPLRKLQLLELVQLGRGHGRGTYPGLKAERLVTDDFVPVCSPALLKGKHPLRKPADLKYHALLHEMGTQIDWRMWLMAAGVQGIDPSRGTVYSHSSMVTQAAINGEGVALGRTALIEEAKREETRAAA